jgi:hypothetical protein
MSGRHGGRFFCVNMGEPILPYGRYERHKLSPTSFRKSRSGQPKTTPMWEKKRPTRKAQLSPNFLRGS